MRQNSILLCLFLLRAFAQCPTNTGCGSCVLDLEGTKPCVWCAGDDGYGVCLSRDDEGRCPKDRQRTAVCMSGTGIALTTIALIAGCCCCCCIAAYFYRRNQSSTHIRPTRVTPSYEYYHPPQPPLEFHTLEEGANPAGYDDYASPQDGGTWNADPQPSHWTVNDPPVDYVPSWNPLPVYVAPIVAPPVFIPAFPPPTPRQLENTFTPAPVTDSPKTNPVDTVPFAGFTAFTTPLPPSPTAFTTPLPPTPTAFTTPLSQLVETASSKMTLNNAPPCREEVDYAQRLKLQLSKENTTTYERAVVELEGRIMSSSFQQDASGIQMSITDIDGKFHQFMVPDYRSAVNFGKRTAGETTFDLNFESAFGPSLPNPLNHATESKQRTVGKHASQPEEKIFNGREVIKTPPTVLLEDKFLLTAIDFHEIIALRQNDYFPGTREWVFEEIKVWLRAPIGVPRLFWLMGGAGTGKSTVAAKLFDIAGINQHLVAWHFCRHDHPSESAVLTLVLSWASMLCANVEGFASALKEAQDLGRLLLSRDDKDFFDNLIAKPLRRMAAPPHPLLLIVDALDELPQSSLAPLLQFITELLPDLPDFVRLFITSRDVVTIKDQLQRFRPMELRVEEANNQQDLRKFLAHVAAKYVTLDMTTPAIEMELERQLVLARGSLSGKLGELEAPIRRSQNSYDAVIQPIKDQTGYLTLSSIDEIRPSVAPLQAVDDLTQLYAQATEARTKLMELFATQWRVLKVIGTTTLQVPVESKAVSWIDNAVEPGLKSKDSTSRKIRDEYKGNCRQMKDLARITAECLTCDRLVSAVDHMKKTEGFRILGLKNRYANLSPMGYRDINMTVEVQLRDGEAHICEIQMNLSSMLVAKEQAHGEYEKVREIIPQITQGWSPKQASEFETRLLKLLRSSVLDSVVRTLESKAGGLFIYAALLEKQMASQSKGGSITQLEAVYTLPAGLSEIYQENFSRLVPADRWDEYVRVVALIGVAREPLSVEMIKQIVGAEEFYQFQAALSGIFPIRENRLHVMHKSIVDWLQDNNRTRQEYILTPTHAKIASRDLAAGIWRTLTHFLDDSEQSHEMKTDSTVDYALRYGVGHMCDAGLAEQAGELALDLRWLLFKVRMQDLPGLLADLEAISQGAKAPSVFVLLMSALRLILDDLRADWRFLPSQLIARLLGHEKNDARIEKLLRTARNWRLDKPWWYPIQQSFQPAGGSCVAIWPEPAANAIAWSPDFKLVSFARNEKIRLMQVETGAWIHVFIGHTATVKALGFSPDGQLLCSGGEDKTLRLWDVKTSECLRTYSGHMDSITTVCWSSDGTKFCSGSDDCTTRMWDVKLSGMMILAQGEEAIKKVFWDDSRIMIQARTQLSVLDLQTRHATSSPPLLDGAISKMAYSEDLSKIFYLLGDREAVTVSTGKGGQANPEECTIYIMDNQGKMSELQGTDEVLDICCSRDGSLLCLALVTDAVVVWNLQTITVKEYIAQKGFDKIVALSSDEKQLFCAVNSCVYGWDLATDTLTHTFAGLPGHIWNIYPVGSHLWTRTRNDTRLWVIDAPCSSVIKSHSGEIQKFFWCPNGKIGCSYADDETLRIWSGATGECLNVVHVNSELSCASLSTITFNADGSKMAVARYKPNDGDRYDIAIFNRESWTFERSFDVNDQVTRIEWLHEDKAIKFQTDHAWGAIFVVQNELTYFFDSDECTVIMSPDWANMLVRREEENVVILADVTAKISKEITLHDSATASAQGLSFSKDGQLVYASVGDEGVVRVWDAITGQIKHEYKADSDEEQEVLVNNLITMGFPNISNRGQKDFPPDLKALACSSSPNWGYALCPTNPSWAFALDDNSPHILHAVRR